MKKLIWKFGLLLVVGFTSCSKRSDEITIVRDCTGTYAQINGEDWLICNYADMVDYAEGTVLSVDYIQLQQCSASEQPQTTCLMYHENRGNIRISAIK